MPLFTSTVIAILIIGLDKNKNNEYTGIELIEMSLLAFDMIVFQKTYTL